MNYSKLLQYVLTVLLVLTGSYGRCQELPLMDLSRAVISMGGYAVDVQVARTPQEHGTGLMFRESLPRDEGMLFVYTYPKVRCMWMKNTKVPLTAAFLDADGVILNLEDMEPETTEGHCSVGPVMYVLEMNRGWFERHGVTAGQRVEIPAEARAQ